MCILFYSTGMKDFMERYGDTLYEVQQVFGPPIKFEGDVLDAVHEDLEKKIPMDKLEERKIWRNKRLAALSKFIASLDD